MKYHLEIGETYTKEKKVTKKDTAAEYGSGLLDVFATPAMIAFMENTALNCVSDKLPKGYNTVGIAINIKHIKATSVGEKVRCEAKLTEINKEKLLFQVSAYDEEGEIGFGTHTRYIIHSESFMHKLKNK